MAYVKPRPKQWRWSCSLCDEDHPLKSCNKFLRASDYERYEVALLSRYCLICLARSHRTKECKADGSCRICDKRHNTLLHDAPQLKKESDRSSKLNRNDSKTADRPHSVIIKPKMENSTTSDRQQKEKSEAEIVNSPQQTLQPKLDEKPKERVPKSTGAVPKITTAKKSEENKTPDFKLVPKQQLAPLILPNVFIPTATVRIFSEDEKTVWSYVRAIINQSTTITKIAASTVKKLGLHVSEKKGHRLATFNLQSRNASNKFNKKVVALITEDLPRRPYVAPFKENPCDEFSEDTLADMDPRSNTLLELELGSDIYSKFRRDGTIELEMGEVIAQKTALGYTFSGPTDKYD